MTLESTRASRRAAVRARLDALPAAARLGLAAGIGLAAGLAADLVAARGPVNTAQGLAVVAIALVAGLVAGLVARTGWAFLVTLVAMAMGTELGRLGIVAPTLDLRLDNAYGVLALVASRGVHGVLLAVPVAAGVAAGVRLARRTRDPRPERRRPPLGTALLWLATGALVVLVAWPASTPPILGPDGRPIPGSIAARETVRLGGTDQTILIRAADPTKPVLLYLSGGPGQSDLALARVMDEGWTRDFVVVGLDQRGNGTSYPAIDPLSSMTLDRAVGDVVELSEQLRDRFGERKIYLMGESWGTILGVLAVRQRPDLYHAWIGSGQMVDVRETDRRIYFQLVDHANRTGDTDLLARLAAVGTPPYADIPWANANLLAWYELIYPPYTPSDGYLARGRAAGMDPFGLLGSEYTALEKPAVLRGLIDTFAVMYPQLQGLDLRTEAARLEVPVWVLDGLAELPGRRDLMLDWFAALDAPAKTRVEFADAAHAVAFEQADAVQRLLVEEIVPATYDR